MNITRGSRGVPLLNHRLAGRELGVWLFIVVLPGACLAGAVFLLIGYASNLAQVRAAADWPRVPGVIESSVYIEPTRRSQASARILYHYDVDGRTYRSRRTIYGAVSADENRALVERYPLGRSVDVIVNPTDPGDAMLEARMGSRSWVLPGFGSALGIIGLSLAWFIWRATAQGVAEAERDAAGLDPNEDLVLPRPPAPRFRERADPRTAVLLPRSTPNTRTPFFWISVGAAVFSFVVAMRGFAQQAGPFLRRVSGVAPVGLALCVLPLLVDLAVWARYAPAARRAEPVEGYLTETRRVDGFPMRVQVTAFYRRPGAGEMTPGGQWRFGLQHVWTESAYDDVRFDYPEGDRTFWVDPANPSVAAMSREVGTLVGLGGRVPLGVGTAVFLAALLERRRRSPDRR